MRRGGGEHREAAALPAQDRGPETARLRREDVVGRGVDDEPAASVELAVELTAGPPRVPGEDAQGLYLDVQVDGIAPEVDRPQGAEQRRPAFGVVGRAGTRQADGGLRRHRPAD